MSKVKSSQILQTALASIEDGSQTFVCAAIQDAEVTYRWENGFEAKTKATKIWAKYKPADINENIRSIIGWWPKGDPQRTEALKDAISKAVKAGD